MINDGGTANLRAWVMALVLLSVTLVIGIYIMAQIGDSLEEDVTTTDTTVNESVASLTVVATDLAILTAHPTATCTVATGGVINATSNESVLVGNYTVSGCTIAAITATEYVDEAVEVTYTYSYTESTATEATSASSDLVTALSNGTSWVAILIVVVFATLVLGFLSSGLGNSANEQQGVVY